MHRFAVQAATAAKGIAAKLPAPKRISKKRAAAKTAHSGANTHGNVLEHKDEINPDDSVSQCSKVNMLIVFA